MKIKQVKTDYDELTELFEKIENLKEFKEWFGTPCPEFEPRCANCEFWTIWNKLKLDVFKNNL